MKNNKLINQSISTISFNDKGLSSILINGVNVLATLTSPIGTFTYPIIRDILWRKITDTTPLIDRQSKASTIFFRGGKDKNVITKSFDILTNTLTINYIWGKISFNYIPKSESQVDVVITVTNTSVDILNSLDLELFKLMLPIDFALPVVGEAMYFGAASTISRLNSLSGPLVLPIISSTSSIIYCSPETAKTLTLYWANSTVVNNLHPWFPVLHVGGDSSLYNNIYDTREILPGASDTYVVSLRFATTTSRMTNSEALDMAKDIFSTYAAAHPMTVNWPDRRPINRTFIGDTYTAANGNILSFNQAANWNNEMHVAVSSPAIDQRSLGEIMGDRLTEFADALERGDDVCAKFTCRKVETPTLGGEIFCQGADRATLKEIATLLIMV